MDYDFDFGRYVNRNSRGFGEYDEGYDYEFAEDFDFDEDFDDNEGFAL